MRWNIIVGCVGEDGKRSTITQGTIEWLVESTTAETLRNQSAGIEQMELRSLLPDFEGMTAKLKNADIQSLLAHYDARITSHVYTEVSHCT